jgi:hypothetical protein
MQGRIPDKSASGGQAGMTYKFGLTYEILSKELQIFKSLAKNLPNILRYLQNKKRISKKRKIWHHITE